jgi:ferritin-like protein
MAHSDTLERVDKQIVAGEQAVRELRDLVNRTHGKDQALAQQMLKLAEDTLVLTVQHRKRIS